MHKSIIKFLHIIYKIFIFCRFYIDFFVQSDSIKVSIGNVTDNVTKNGSGNVSKTRDCIPQWKERGIYEEEIFKCSS